MASKRIVGIVQGPSKWDMLVKGLGEVQHVEFTFSDLGKRYVRLALVGPEDGSGNNWLIHGWIQSGENTPKMHCEGNYSTVTRKGFVDVQSDSIIR